MSICCPLGMAKTETQWEQFKLAAWGHEDIFCKNTDSGSRESGSMLSAYFIRWWLLLSAHSVINVEG